MTTSTSGANMNNHNEKQRLLNQVYEPFRDVSSCPFAFTDLTQTVFGEGNPSATLMFIGEAPGRDEDRLGKPFVGRSGQLLNRVLEAVGTSRRDVFITNVVKWRPPNNRKPTPAEMAVGKKLLDQEIIVIRPKVICTLGSSALHTLLGPEISISRARGNVFKQNGTLILPTYHPAYILRNKNELENFMSDITRAVEIAKSRQ